MSSALLTTSLTWGLKAVKTEGESLRAGHRKKSDPAEKASPADIFKQRAEKENKDQLRSVPVDFIIMEDVDSIYIVFAFGSANFRTIHMSSAWQTTMCTVHDEG